MSWPYVAQDEHGGWYADCDGLMQDGNPARTREQALQWCVDRLAHKLGQARHGCEYLMPPCILHQEGFSEQDYALMVEQMREANVEVPGEWPKGKVLRRYESWSTARVQAWKQISW